MKWHNQAIIDMYWWLCQEFTTVECYINESRNNLRMTKIGHDETVTTNREIVANHLNVSIFTHILSGRKTMRNPDRLDTFYEEMKKLHKEYVPDWRFGQLCCNFFGWVASEKKLDIFFPEENKMLILLIEYCKSLKGENKE